MTVTHEHLSDSQNRAVSELERARARILTLMSEVTDAQLKRQWMPILSPMVWDLGHVGNYEDLWLVQTLAGERERVTPARLDPLYDAFQQPRGVRERLPLLGPDEARTYIASVRERSLRAIEDGLLDPEMAAGEEQLVRDAFVLGLIVQHEHQHAETILQARQAMLEQAAPLHHAQRSTKALNHSTLKTDPLAVEWIRHSGGEGTIGTSSNPWAYDNERPAHQVKLEPFLIARDPVSCALWIEFIKAGGYAREELWSAAGWAWRMSENVEAPLYWRPTGDEAATYGSKQEFLVLRFGEWMEVNAHEPVQHVSWYEAEAFVNWACDRWPGTRLPTEQEWEAAASWGETPARVDEANLGTNFDGPIPPELCDTTAACRSMLGNVWEWTSSYFAPWPGFTIFPYAEYSAEFFGNRYRVLRGGSWATDQEVCRPTFRNWDLPQRRQLFAGLRLARSLPLPEDLR